MVSADLMIWQTNGVRRTATNAHFVQQGKALMVFHPIDNIKSCHSIHPASESQCFQPLLATSRSSRTRSLSVVQQNFSSLRL